MAECQSLAARSPTRTSWSNTKESLRVSTNPAFNLSKKGVRPPTHVILVSTRYEPRKRLRLGLMKRFLHEPDEKGRKLSIFYSNTSPNSSNPNNSTSYQNSSLHSPRCLPPKSVFHPPVSYSLLSPTNIHPADHLRLRSQTPPTPTPTPTPTRLRAVALQDSQKRVGAAHAAQNRAIKKHAAAEGRRAWFAGGRSERLRRCFGCGGGVSLSEGRNAGVSYLAM